VDLSQFPNVAQYADPHPVNLETFKRLCAEVLPLIPGKLVPTPGARFGPLDGKIHGPVANFVWRDAWTPLVEKETLSRLRASELRFPEAVSTALEVVGSANQRLFEFELWPVANLVAGTYGLDELSPCHVCGRLGVNMADRPIVIAAASIPAGMDLFRTWEAPTFIIATERFFEVLLTLRLTGVRLDEVEVL
jgi:uncharacterized double-CXXCG motif protein